MVVASEEKVKRKLWPCELCQGLMGASCVFSTQRATGRATVQPKRLGGEHCVFCLAENFQRAVDAPRGKGAITAALAFFQENNVEVFDLACARIRTFTDQATLDGCLTRLNRLLQKGKTTKGTRRGSTAQQLEALARPSCLPDMLHKGRRQEVQRECTKERSATARSQVSWPLPCRRAASQTRNYVANAVGGVLQTICRRIFLEHVLSMPPVSAAEVPSKTCPGNSPRPGVAEDHRSLQALQEESWLQGANRGRCASTVARVVTERVGCLGNFQGSHRSL